MSTPPLPPSTILLVEDDDQVRSLVRTLLTSEGFRVLEARTGTEALSLVAEHDGSIDLLLADMLLPEVSGFEVASQLKVRYPAAKVLFMTGWVEGEIVQRCVSELNAAFLDKPFQPAKLRQIVKEMLAGSAKCAEC
jgi:CheY-like chemotaxis protein